MATSLVAPRHAFARQSSGECTPAPPHARPGSMQAPDSPSRTPASHGAADRFTWSAPELQPARDLLQVRLTGLPECNFRVSCGRYYYARMDYSSAVCAVPTIAGSGPKPSPAVVVAARLDRGGCRRCQPCCQPCPAASGPGELCPAAHSLILLANFRMPAAPLPRSLSQ